MLYTCGGTLFRRFSFSRDSRIAINACKFFALLRQLLENENQFFSVNYEALQIESVDHCLVDSPRDSIPKPPQRLRDLQLVCRSQTGDADAFAELVGRYRARIFTVVNRIVRHEQDALDIVQDVFFKAWQSIHQFEGRSSFYVWLYRLAINMACFSVRRKGQRKDEVLSDAIPSSLPSPPLNCQRIEIEVWLNAAFAKLSAEHRAVILLKEVECMRYHEIAAFLNISVGTVMSRLFYAKRHLRSLLRPIYKQLYA